MESATRTHEDRVALEISCHSTKDWQTRAGTGTGTQQRKSWPQGPLSPSSGRPEKGSKWGSRVGSSVSSQAARACELTSSTVGSSSESFSTCPRSVHLLQLAAAAALRSPSARQLSLSENTLTLGRSFSAAPAAPLAAFRVAMSQ